MAFNFSCQQGARQTQKIIKCRYWTDWTDWTD